MKPFRKIAFIIFGAAILFSCAPHHKTRTHHIPPGHVKKITKSKSARPYAPGQVKKMKHKKGPKPKRHFRG